jgi:hypothetical protein
MTGEKIARARVQRTKKKPHWSKTKYVSTNIMTLANSAYMRARRGVQKKKISSTKTTQPIFKNKAERWDMGVIYLSSSKASI